MPKSVTGMPHTASGVTQIGYLELTSPDGFGVDVQFMPNASDARTELAAAEKSMPGCHGKTVGNALVFSRGDGHLVIPPKTLKDVKGLLRA